MAPSGEKDMSTGNGARVLIPVDFSQRGSLALRVGFELARRLEREVTLLHAEVVPVATAAFPQFPEDINGVDTEDGAMEEMEVSLEVHRVDEDAMGRLRSHIRTLQTSGALPAIAYDTVLAPGMPEEVISEYCSSTPPLVAVMATRGCERRREELIGSVTAEVIDHCVAPVFTVPEDYTFEGFNAIVRICAFCFFEEADFTAVSRLMEMFGNPSVTVWLFPATDKYRGEVLSGKLEALQSRLATAFPSSEFRCAAVADVRNLRTEAETLFAGEKIQMILAPNRHRNALARFFNPGLAHKILYEIDFPMLAIPV